MNDVNSVVLVGRLAQEPELSNLNNGTPLLKFAIAVNYSKKVGNQWTDQASFFDCTLFGNLAPTIVQFMRKGGRVAVQGALRQDRWEQNGQSRSKVVVNAKTVQVLDSPQNNGQGYNQAPYQVPYPQQQPQPQPQYQAAYPQPQAPPRNTQSFPPSAYGQSQQAGPEQFEDDIPI